MPSQINVHAIIIALNEEDFIQETIRPIYKHCSGISVITQYDRDYYGKKVVPDHTIAKVLEYPDPEGKIHVVVRRYNDETASRNHEMKAVLFDASKGILAHGGNIEQVRAFHQAPDYFLIVDADEIYDEDTFPKIIEYLVSKKPRGMRVSAFEYGHSWHYRVPLSRYVHHQFGFIKAGILFETRRVVTWNEFRLKKLFSILKISGGLATRFFGFIDCPLEVGMFHHAAYVRKDASKLIQKMRQHSHPEFHNLDFIRKVLKQDYDFVNKNELPRNIQDGNWPEVFWNESIEIFSELK